MMAAFRAFSKSPVAIALFGLLVISFAIWGVRDVFHTRISDSVVSAGSRRISKEAFKQRFEQALQQLQKQTGQPVTAQDAAQHGVIQQMLDELATQMAVLQTIDSSGVKPSDKLLLQEVRKIPAFFNPVTGAFDQKTYQDLLGRNGLTPALFEQQLRDELSMLHFTSGMVAGWRAPLTYTALFSGIDQQSRAADYFVLDQKSVPPPAMPSDADLMKFMKTLEDRLRQPETRQISLVRISAQAIAPTLHPSQADVEKQFEIVKGRLSMPERRTFVQIPAKDAAQAAAMAARLTKGEDATAVAKAYGVKPISYADIPQGAVTDPSVAKVVFSLGVGQSSGPIQGLNGYAVAKLVSVTPGKPATLEDARSQIEKTLNDQAALQQAYDQSEKYSDAHAAGKPMADAAKAAGVQVYALPPVSADGKIASGQPLPSLTQKMLSDAFSLPQGGETEMTDLGKGEYYALRVEKVIPSALPSLDKIRAPLARVYMQKQLVDRLKAKADGLAARVKKGEALGVVAASAGAKVQHVQLARTNAAQQQALGQEFLSQLFQAKSGDVFEAGGVNFGVAIARVTTITPGAATEVARQAQSLRPQVTEQMAGNEFQEMIYGAARTKVKPKVDEKLAMEAAGVQADQVPASLGKSSGKAP